MLQKLLGVLELLKQFWFEALSEYFKLDTSNLILMGLLIYTNKKETDEKNKPYYNN